MTAQGIEQYYVPDIAQIESHEPATYAKRRMDTTEERSIIVVEDNRPIGILKRNALLKLGMEELEVPVTTYMDREFPVIRQGEPVEVASTRAGHDINIEQIPVVSESGELVGAIQRQWLASQGGTATGGTTTESNDAQVIVGERLPVEEGMDVKDSSGSKIGSLVHATFQTDGNVEFFVVEHGLIFKHQKQLPGDLIDRVEDEAIHLKVGKSEFDVIKDIGEE